MSRIRPDVDIVLDVLNAVLRVQPSSGFVQSLHHQYIERGGLSKKQLEGLLAKAKKIDDIPVNKIATLEAIILRKHSKQRSDLPQTAPLYQKDETAASLIGQILEKAPRHKRVLFLKTKLENNEPLSASELRELEQFNKLLK
jgi:hypothetical protein